MNVQYFLTFRKQTNLTMKEYARAFKKYADFNGRARRREYWMFMLFHMIIVYTSMFLTFVVGPIAMVLIMAYLFATFIPTLALTVRRMHDTGNPGIYMLIPVYSLILAITEGNKGPNQYGPDPKDQVTGNTDLLDDQMLGTKG